MRYDSCSTNHKNVSFEEAVLSGWANGNGMFLPSYIPQIPYETILSWQNYTYQELAKVILRYFVSCEEITDVEWEGIFITMYADFLDPVIQYSKYSDMGSSIYIADLSRGPSLAFKDLGMQCLCSILDFLLQRKKKTLTVLVATSGDTGPSAMISLKNKPNINIIVLYPADRISIEQEAQMLAYDQQLTNTKCFSVQGTSDELDTLTESIFKDAEFKEEQSLGSVNSVNILRLLAQIVHFFDMYLHALRTTIISTNTREFNESPLTISVSIPTGAAGHFTAATIAKLMGLPIDYIIVATNKNDVLHQLLTTGIFWKPNHVYQTFATAMDIAVPYNLERLFYLANGRNTETTKSIMDTFRNGENLVISPDINAWFHSMSIISCPISDNGILSTLRDSYSKNCLQDPHTCVGIKAAEMLQNKGILQGIVYCMGCANPIKFSKTIHIALGSQIIGDEALQKICDGNRHAAALAKYVEDSSSLHRRRVFVKGEDWIERLKHEIVHF